MACSGHCFDIISLEAPSSFHDLVEESLQAPTDQAAELYTYSDLKPWQTRILRLHPSELSHQLSADLLVAAIPDTEDLLLESTGAKVEYTALSYSWARPELCETLVCNGGNMPISRSNAAALVSLRSHTKLRYVWIDAICINQEDDLEKSAQVAKMLSIYKKARSVTVWIGEPDTDSRLAFACIEGLSKLQKEMRQYGKTTHVPSCYNQLRSISRAIRSLYERPWIRRTWIRQEIYGARRITIRCGIYQISWDGFVGAADVVKTMRALVKDEESISEPREAHYNRLLGEAMRNATMPPSGIKSPRDLVEVLLQARHFEVSDPKDTFYAVLGMCNVVAFSNAPGEPPQNSKGAVLIDYNKTLVEVYRDATSCILHRKGGPDKLADLWHSYRRGSLHMEGLPYWAVDWQSGTSADGAALKFIGSRPLPIDRTLSPAKSDGRYTMGNKAAAPSRAWYWPEPVHSDANILRLRARALNYVAYLTDFTCEPAKFLEERLEDRLGSDQRDERLGSTGLTIHGTKLLRDPLVGHAIVYPAPEWKQFDPQEHSLRVAILGVGNDSQICLVPSNTKKGDLIVAIAPGLFAMVISPMQGDGTAGGLIPQNDPYEGVTKESSRVCQPWKAMISLCDLPVFFLAPATFFATAATIGQGIVACTLAMAHCGLLLLFFLSEYLVWGHRLRYMKGDFPCPRMYGNFLLMVQSVGVGLFLSTTSVTKLGLSISFFTMLKLWRVYHQIDCHVRIASRRIEVSKTLNNATGTLGHDYEFRGPVFIRYWDRHLVSGHELLPLYLKLRFAIGTLLHIRSRERQRLKAEFFEIWDSSERDRIEWWEDGYVWDRPIQEFRLH
jgi:hypothetical protein